MNSDNSQLNTPEAPRSTDDPPASDGSIATVASKPRSRRAGVHAGVPSWWSELAVRIARGETVAGAAKACGHSRGAAHSALKHAAWPGLLERAADAARQEAERRLDLALPDAVQRLGEAARGTDAAAVAAAAKIVALHTQRERNANQAAAARARDPLEAAAPTHDPGSGPALEPFTPGRPSTSIRTMSDTAIAIEMIAAVGSMVRGGGAIQLSAAQVDEIAHAVLVHLGDWLRARGIASGGAGIVEVIDRPLVRGALPASTGAETLTMAEKAAMRASDPSRPIR